MRIYQRIIRLLKTHLPVSLPVSVRRVELPGYDGVCGKRQDKFQIRINRNLSEKEAIDALLHEYSHAVWWPDSADSMSNDEFQSLVHCDEWGRAYAQVYRVFDTHFLKTLNS